MAKATAPVSAKSKPISEKKPKGNTKTTKIPSPLHPPYFQMITEAISSLKDRTGSSQQAIAKFIEEKYKTGLPPNFKKLLSIQLKKFAKSERLVKVKNSFKISPTEKVNLVSLEVKEKLKKKKTEEDTKKLIKTKRVSKVSTPETKKVSKAKKAVKAEKIKSLKQVKTPDCLKKVSSPKKKALKLKPATKKTRV